MAETSIDLLSISNPEGNLDDGKMEVAPSIPSSFENGSSIMESEKNETQTIHVPYQLTTPVSLPTSKTANCMNKTIEASNLAQEEIISHVANCCEEVFLRSQHCDEPTYSNLQKREIAASLLKSSPLNFLVKFGKYLEPSHLSYFNQYQDSDEVSYYLHQLEKPTDAPEKCVRNRRFHAMNEMIKEGKYFSMDAMRKRNPILFHELVEKYMTAEEKGLLEQEQPKICNLSTVFMAHIDGGETCSKRRNEQLTYQSAWDETSADEEEEEEDIDQDEKEFFRDEFVSGMYSSFLQGHDEEFDYSKIDSSHPNDIIHERDAEERYFDAD